MVDVIHTADTHLGYAQYHKEERKQDFLDAFITVIDGAIDADVDAVIHAGDFFEDKSPSLDTMMDLNEQLKRLQENDIEFLAIVGNHEGRTGSNQWIDLFQSFGLLTRLGSEPTIIGDTAFYGLDHHSKTQRAKLDYRFIETDEAEHTALVAHGLFAPLSVSDWDAAEVLSSANISFDAMLCGDDHEPKTDLINETVVTYPGSTERTASDQTKDRGYNRVRIGDNVPDPEDGTNVSVERVTFPTRPFVSTTATLEEEQGADHIRHLISQYDLEDACVFVTIEGDGRPVTPASVEEYALEKGALLCRVKDAREFDTERDVSDISFSDPATAARERAEEMSLSSVGEQAEEMVRDQDIADTNVRESLESLISEQLEEDADEFNRPDDEAKTDDNDEDDSSVTPGESLPTREEFRSALKGEDTDSTDEDSDSDDGTDDNSWDEHWGDDDGETQSGLQDF